MRYRTGQEVQDDVFELLQGSELANKVNGSVLHYGTRSRDSQSEDIVVRFVTGLANQIESGVVAIMIYVPDLDFGGTGQYVPDLTRLTELEEEAENWVRSLDRKTYYWTLVETIQTVQDEDINQHFVTIRLRYRALYQNVKLKEKEDEDNNLDTPND